MYYQAVVAFETGVVDNEGKTKVKKYKYVVESESVYEATTRLSHYLGEDTRESEIISVTQAQFEDLLHPELTPKYYTN